MFRHILRFAAAPACSFIFLIGLNQSASALTMVPASVKIAFVSSAVADFSAQSPAPSTVLSAPSCTSASPATASIAYDAPTQTVTAYGVKSATQVWFPTWQQASGQKDIVWAQGVNQAGTDTWSISIPMSKFDSTGAVYGIFETDVYLVNPDYNSGQFVGCAPTSWVRQTPPPPNPPTLVSVPATSNIATVNFNWTKAASGTIPSSYQIQRRLSTAGTWTPVNSSSSTSSSDEVPSVGLYYYEVAACITSACSAYTVSANGVDVVSPGTTTLPPLPAEVTDVLPAHDATVGTMSGQARTDGGAAVYEVPIAVPPGRNGMQPSLSFTYNSRGGNGVMGLGWTISGLSSIHRCPQTPEQDGQTLGVAYANTDRLCLDGQRLVVTNGGTYGASGAQYHTEIDNYARVTQTGGDLTGAATCFRVEHKDGRILHYGAVTTGSPLASGCSSSSANSRVQPKGTTAAPLSWLLEKIEDRVGNNQLYAYGVFGSGENLLDSVSYTGFGTAAGDRKVTFSYDVRSSLASGSTDIASSYLAGGLTLQTRAVSLIGTSVNGVPVRTYTPHYVVAAYSGRLLMESIKECAGTTCHSPTNFFYNDDVINTAENFPFTSLSGITIAEGVSDESSQTPLVIHTIGDLDGDGTRETAVASNTSTGTRYYLVQMTGDRAAHKAVDLTGTGFDIAVSSYADIDGDGRAKLIKPPSAAGNLIFGAWKLARGTSLQSATTYAYNDLFTDYTSTIPAAPSDIFYSGDFNGDGKTDIVKVTGTTAACAPGKAVWIYINNMTGYLGSAGNTTANFTIPTQQAFCLALSSTSGSVSAQTIDHINDFDGDGLPDFYLRTESITSGPLGTTSSSRFDGIRITHATATTITSTLKACGTALGLINDATVNSATDDCTWSQPKAQSNFATWLDVNGDGLEDLIIARPNQHTWRVRLNQGGIFGAEIDTGSSYGLDTLSSGLGFRYAGRLPSMDVDSDGKPDLLVPLSDATPNSAFALKMCTILTYQFSGPECPDSSLVAGSVIPDNTQTCALYACPSEPGSSMLNMPSELHGQKVFDTYSTNSRVSTGGVDNSLYHLAMLKFVQTDATHIHIVPSHTPLISRLNNPNQPTVGGDDLFGDGLADLTTVAGCTKHAVVFGLNQCLTVADGKYGPAEPLPDGTPIACPLGGTCAFDTKAVLYANINQGVTGLSAATRDALVGMQQPSAVATPQSISLNLALPTLPGLLDGVANGLGDVSSWSYLPLSVPFNQYGLALYTVPAANGYSDSRHYYFQSSMPVVTGMLQTPAVGSDYGGFRSMVYGYSEAMYNHFGRGFQGFYQIASKLYSPISSIENLAEETVATYHQKFPLTGKVACVHTLVPSTGTSSSIACLDSTTPVTGTIVRTETDTWTCASNRAACAQDTAIPPAPSTGGTKYSPLLDTQIVKSYDLATGTQYAQSDTVNGSGATTSGWDAYGNLAYQKTTRADKGISAQLFVSSHTTTTSNSYAVADTPNWWINKLTTSAVTGSIVYGSNHPLPSTASANNQTVITNYTWNADRTLATKTGQGGSTSQPNKRSVVTTCYPQSVATTSPACPVTPGNTTSYGVPVQTKICLGTYDAGGNCVGDVGSLLSPERTTRFTYTKDGSTAANDGYFVLTTKNALSQTTTTTYRPGDGQVLTTTDPNNVQTIALYDAFGRPIEVDHRDNSGSHTNIESPIKTAFTSCLTMPAPPALPIPRPGHCPLGLGEDGNEINAAYRITTVQAGYPTHITWFDLLGREIKTATRGYTGTFIETTSEYSDMGTLAFKSAPFYAGDTRYETGWTYDALNRPTIKNAPGSELNPTEGNVETDYSYSGRQTKLTVHATGSAYKPVGGVCPSGASNLCISMSRSTNVLGQYMQTVDANGKQTNFWTDPAGHVVAMTDPEANLTTATYNELGQRTRSNDPDQGIWNFTYDALGELLTQTDARNVVTTVNSRDALGRTREQQQIPPGGTILGLDPNLYVDDWSCDPVNGIGALDSVVRYSGTNRTTPLATHNPQVWKEQYAYDATTARPIKTITTIAGAATPLISQMTYDSKGRPDTHTYPSGLVVQSQYAKYGHPGAIAKKVGTTSTILWEATAMDAWGKVKNESYIDGTTGVTSYYEGTGQENTATWTLAAHPADKLTYAYDSFGNLTKQTRIALNESNSESYLYDHLQRLLNATRTNGAAVNYGYSNSGNLKYKDDFSVNSGAGISAYSYAAAGSKVNRCGPHAVNQVTLPGGSPATYICDANGNIISGNTLSATYDADNHPRAVTRAGTGYTNNWTYDANGHPSSETSSEGTRTFGPSGYELVGTKSIHELGPILITRVGTTDVITTTLRDRLGSTIAAIDNSIQFPNSARTYDAFGKVRNGDFTDKAKGTLNLGDTIHGFTQHNHVDDVQIIHMGGRIYDYQLGRFLNVDPIIGNPLSSQSLNPYSYIGNNPLSGTDPTGYAACDAGGQVGGGCLESGVNTVTKDGKVIGTVIVGNQGDQVRLTDTTTHMSNAYTIGNGAQKLDYTNILSTNVSTDKIQSLTSKDLGPAKSAAMLSKCAYGSCTLPADVMPTDLGFNEQHHINPGLYDDEGAQFHAESFVSNDGADAYVAFRGTRPTNLQDWETNLGQGAGLKTKSYQDAFNLGAAFSQGVPDSINKLFVGHSLGGGLASLAGITSGERTSTFNSAGLSSGTLARYRVTRGSANGLVSAYYLRGEVLSGLQDHSFLPKAVGTRITIDPISSTPWSAVGRHGMDAVLDAMNGGQ